MVLFFRLVHFNICCKIIPFKWQLRLPNIYLQELSIVLLSFNMIPCLQWLRNLKKLINTQRSVTVYLNTDVFTCNCISCVA